MIRRYEIMLKPQNENKRPLKTEHSENEKKCWEFKRTRVELKETIEGR